VVSISIKVSTPLDNRIEGCLGQNPWWDKDVWIGEEPGPETEAESGAVVTNRKYLVFGNIS